MIIGQLKIRRLELAVKTFPNLSDSVFNKERTFIKKCIHNLRSSVYQISTRLSQDNLPGTFFTGDTRSTTSPSLIHKPVR